MQDATFHDLLRGRGQKAKLAEALNVDRSIVSRWIERRVPAERVLEVERATGIHRSKIRPDLYPPSELEGAAPYCGALSEEPAT
ncbi:CI repressor [Methylovirgula ligni]|uniref:YdaS antitoxin of YdaST toxin-antitoxin system n=1 Tax=Methylovirgula ligni TaxID=569860 RepID=A0A3D9YL24_9HYPH|nr:YdaS family helix-turn-helix protein [Methylovirgula ligni]QAY96680.1 CI repressor [Methylovirgula ligni]REF83280.1 YdaS antitoxin of YdaST toxin-antitoxin system [Methylovirgula ligni]